MSVVAGRPSSITRVLTPRGVAIAVLLLLMACDSKPRNESPPQIFSDQARALDQARGVEKTLEQAEQKRREEEDRAQ